MTDRHVITRVRQPLRRRILSVHRSERITPRMARIELVGDDLEGFVSAGYDDHVKLFIPEAGQALPTMPELGPDGPIRPPGVRLSPARARPGDKLGVAGPRGSFVVDDDFDWYLLVGDETALPAIGRRLEELRADVPAIVVAAVEGRDEEQRFDSRTRLAVHWVHRPAERASDPAPLLDAVKALALPGGDGYAWIAGETTMAQAVRRHLVDERGHDKRWIKAAGYWRRGRAAVHDTYDDGSA